MRPFSESPIARLRREPLLYDNEPIEQVVYRHPSSRATPADVVDRAVRGMPLSGRDVSALLRVLERHPDEIDVILRGSGSSLGRTVLETLWATARRQPSRAPAIELAVALAFYPPVRQGRFPRRSVWESLTQMQRECGDGNSHKQADKLIIQLHKPLTKRALAHWASTQRSGESLPYCIPSLDEKLVEDIERVSLFDVGKKSRRAPWVPGIVSQLSWPGVRASVAQKLERREDQSVIILYGLYLILTVTEQVAGSENSMVASCLNRLFLLLREDDPRIAIDLARTALAIREKTLGRAHNLLALSCHNLAGVLVAVDELDEALQLLRRAIALSPGRPVSYYWLAKLFQKQGNDPRSELAAWRRFLRLGSNKLERIREGRVRLAELRRQL